MKPRQRGASAKQTLASTANDHCQFGGDVGCLHGFDHVVKRSDHCVQERRRIKVPGLRFDLEVAERGPSEIGAATNGHCRCRSELGPQHGRDRVVQRGESYAAVWREEKRQVLAVRIGIANCDGERHDPGKAKAGQRQLAVVVKRERPLIETADVIIEPFRGVGLDTAWPLSGIIACDHDRRRVTE
jgi:hypothetical protein